jgi:ornithine carbamoyltransferase
MQGGVFSRPLKNARLNVKSQMADGKTKAFTIYDLPFAIQDAFFSILPDPAEGCEAAPCRRRRAGSSAARFTVRENEMSTRELTPIVTTRFLSIDDVTHEELQDCLRLAAELKAARAAGIRHEQPLVGRHFALLFEKPSLRTRSTFQIAVRELGGDLIEPPREEVFGERETIGDVARNLERWVYGAVVRTYAQSRLEAFAAAAPRLRVVNALTDDEHPCQALADCLTLAEKLHDLPGRTITFVGDGNNVATSLAQAAVLLGVNVRIASPHGFELDPRVRHRIDSRARLGARLTVTNDPVAAVRDAHAVYTDVWTSMGREGEAAPRREIFGAYQVNASLMAHASPDAIFMHCLPAHRGDEVTSEVLDSDASVVFDQAENRLHTQKALLAMLG